MDSVCILNVPLNQKRTTTYRASKQSFKQAQPRIKHKHSSNENIWNV